MSSEIDGLGHSIHLPIYFKEILLLSMGINP
jgi:hypothetical protein